MNSKKSLILKAVAVLVIVWTVVFVVRSLASAERVTAEKLEQTVTEVGFADWSEGPGGRKEAKVREKEIRRVAEMVNQLDFKEREKNRERRTAERFFRKLGNREKELFIELTVVESMGRFMEALDQMPEAQRQEFVEKGLEEIREGNTELEMERAEALDQELLTKISQEGMRAYFNQSSAETKLDLAPLMQAMNEVMQGLRGNQFGPQ